MNRSLIPVPRQDPRPARRPSSARARQAAGRAAVAVAALVLLIVGGPPASAQPVSPVTDLQTVVNNITYWITGLVAAVATLFLVIGGARYLMAGGDPSEVERAKGALKSAAIGYALVLLAPLFLTILNTQILRD